MNIRYRLELEDYWSFQKFYLFKRRLRPVFLYPFLALIGLLSLAGLWLAYAKWHQSGSIDFYLLVLPMLVILYPWYFKANTLRRAKSTAGYGEEVVLSIEKQYVMTTTSTVEVKRAWSIIHEIVDAQDYLYIFLTKTVALLVPKRFFPTSEDAAAFVTAAVHAKQTAVPGLGIGNATDENVWPPAPQIER